MEKGLLSIADNSPLVRQEAKMKYVIGNQAGVAIS